MNFNEFKFFNIRELTIIRLFFFIKKILTLFPEQLISERNILFFKILPNYKVKYLNKEKQYLVESKTFKYKLRKNTSDLLVFNQIIVEKEYLPIIRYFNHIKKKPKYIFDCGANIGLSSLFFKEHFPEANLIAIEPFYLNYIQMEKNFQINSIPNAIMLNQGVWSHDTFLCIDDTFRDRKEWSIKLFQAQTNNNIEAHTIEFYMKKFNIPYIDLLKIDIEGGEVELFLKSKNIEWLEKVHVLAIEIHDEFNCRVEIEEMFRKHHFEISHHKELTIGINYQWNY